MVSIDTGGNYIDSGSQPYDPSKLETSGVTLFSPGDDDIYSRVFFVPDGKQVILRAYNIPTEYHITVENVMLGTSSMLSVNKSCCPAILPVKDKQLILYSAPIHTNGGAWKLTADINTGVIALPGYYRLVASDQRMLENLFVALQVTSIIPKIDNQLVTG